MMMYAFVIVVVINYIKVFPISGRVPISGLLRCYLRTVRTCCNRSESMTTPISTRGQLGNPFTSSSTAGIWRCRIVHMLCSLSFCLLHHLSAGSVGCLASGDICSSSTRAACIRSASPANGSRLARRIGRATRLSSRPRRTNG